MHKKTIIDFKELGQRLIFTAPLEELVAWELAEVGAVLTHVAHYQQAGYYVVGYLSYEAARFFDPKLVTHTQPLAGEAYAYFTVHSSAETQPLPVAAAPVDLPTDWVELFDKESYRAAIDRIHEEIRQGNTYQVNYTVQIKQDIHADPEAIYQRLVVAQAAGYNAYIAHDEVAILSASPELFFKLEGETLTTRPMKGTTQRGRHEAEDQARRAWLAQDSKNRAENMMIVDLLRNDMGRVCQTGSVKVAQLCQVEQYSTVWQMTSTIEGRLKPGLSLVEILAALYPCGSITGAPKMSTMAIIQQLEPAPRGVYCGTIGLCLPDGRQYFNVPIRTLQLTGTTAYYGVGGGITWDSEWADEYEETRQKRAVLSRQPAQFELWTTGRVTDGALTFAPQHLARLDQASRFFGFPFDQMAYQAQLDQILQAQPVQTDQRLKIRLNRQGQVMFEAQPLTPLADNFLVASLTKVDVPVTAFHFFKTSQRGHLPQGQGEQLYVTADGRLLETSIGNLVLDLAGRLVTPSLEAGLLDGIYRRHLLETGQVVEADLGLEDLARADRVLVCNAVRGLYEIQVKLEDLDEEFTN